MRMDEDIWLSAVRRPIWLCQRATRERADTRGHVSIGRCSLPYMPSSSSSSFTGWNCWYFMLLLFLREMNPSAIDCCSCAKRACYYSPTSRAFSKSQFLFPAEVGASGNARGATLDDWGERISTLRETVIDFTVFLCPSLLCEASGAAVWHPTTNTLQGGGPSTGRSTGRLYQSIRPSAGALLALSLVLPSSSQVSSSLLGNVGFLAATELRRPAFIMWVSFQRDSRALR